MKRISSIATLLCLLASVVMGQDAKSASPSLLKASFSKLPIYFIENRGVYPDEVKFYIQGADKTLFFTKGGITFRLKGKDRAWAVQLEFVGANPEVVPQGRDRQEAVFSYFKGPEEDWKAGLKTFAKVVYEELWPGIDLVYRGTVNRLKYEFVVRPGADTGKIKLRYHGATSVMLTEEGALRVETPASSFQDVPPVAWQEVEGVRVPVKVAYAQPRGRSEFGFTVGSYDSTKSLVIDPAVIVYCGYIGGSEEDKGYGIAVDAAGNAYVTGVTESLETTFPVAVGPDMTFNKGLQDAFVAKVNRTGTALVYCGYIGGDLYDWGRDIAVDRRGNAYVTGVAQSHQNTFPVKVGPNLTHNVSYHGYDVFVAKVNAQGTGLDYCGFIGGDNEDYGYGIALDTAGNAYVAGGTRSNRGFPVKVGPDLTHNGHFDAFVAKVNAQGTGLDYCGYIGGASYEYGYDIAVDSAGNAYVTGTTDSPQASFPVKVGPDTTFNGGRYEAFVAKVNAKGTALSYCGYIGGTGWDYGGSIAVDVAGNAYVMGETNSNEQSFPVKVGPDLTHNGGPYDAFVAKVNAQGSALVYCGYIGGVYNEFDGGIAVDATGNAYVAGITKSSENTFPVKEGPDLTYNYYGEDAFVAKVNPEGTMLLYCGYIGGSGKVEGMDIDVDAAGNAYVTGTTKADEKTFPVKSGPDLTYNGDIDAFVAKVVVTLLIKGSGTPRPGGTVSFDLIATCDGAHPYQVGSSLGTGPISIGNQSIGLSLDHMLVISLMGFCPGVFSNYCGVMNSKGQANAAIHIPNDPVLIGLRIHTAFVTLAPAAPSGIRSISNTFSFSITK